MLNFLSNPSKTINARLKEYEDLQRTLSLINSNKVVTLLDVRAAFFDKGQRSLLPAGKDVPLGITGRMFFNPGYELRSFFNKEVCEDIASIPLPVSLLNTQSRQEYEWTFSAPKYSEQTRLTQQKAMVEDLKRNFPDVPEKNLRAYLGDLRPQHLDCVYLGDFMAMLNQGPLSLERVAKVSVALGQSTKTQIILNSLRHAPDYSHHFSDMPPRNGEGKKGNDKTEIPAFVPGALQPL